MGGGYSQSEAQVDGFQNVQAVRADRPVRVSVVLTVEEVKQVMAAITRTPQLGSSLY
jgi:hypothetical protein